jgi:hypothetical protein
VIGAFWGVELDMRFDLTDEEEAAFLKELNQTAPIAKPQSKPVVESFITLASAKLTAERVAARCAAHGPGIWLSTLLGCHVVATSIGNPGLYRLTI